jgi:hypothetical protein
LLLKKNRRFTNVIAENRLLPSVKELIQMLLPSFWFYWDGYFSAQKIIDAAVLFEGHVYLFTFEIPDLFYLSTK